MMSSYPHDNPSVSRDNHDITCCALQPTADSVEPVNTARLADNATSGFGVQRGEQEFLSQHDILSLEHPDYLADNFSIPTRAHRQAISSDGCFPESDSEAQFIASCPSMATMWPNYQLSDSILEIGSATPGPQALEPSVHEMAKYPLDDVVTHDAGVDCLDLLRSPRDEDARVLREFYRAKHTLVLDSTCPETVPHIVISFAQDTWEDYQIVWNNRIYYQHPTHLVVPPIPISIESLPPRPLPRQLSFVQELDSVSPSVACQGQSISNGVIPHKPKRVFSPGRLIRYHEKSNIEGVKYPELVQMLHVRHLKASMLLTNDKAASKQNSSRASRHDALVEKPFSWTDPAEPLLAYHRRLAGTTIIDSPSPFIVPHIIINAPPPEDFMIPWQNATNNPQDCGFGQYLTVPNQYVHFDNIPYDDWNPCSPYQYHITTGIDASMEANYMEDNDDDNGHKTDLGVPHRDVDSSDDDTEEPWCWTPSPSTPVCGTGGHDLVVIVGEGQGRNYDDDEEDSDDEMVLMANRSGKLRFMHTRLHRFGQVHANSSHVDRNETIFGGAQMDGDWFGNDDKFSQSEEGSTDGSGCSSDDVDDDSEDLIAENPQEVREVDKEPSRPSCSIFVDDDEEDLPPFDEWYQEMARRSNLECTAI